MEMILTFAMIALVGGHVSAAELTGTISTGVSTGMSGTVIADPVFSPVSGSYAGSQSVSITASGANAVCYTSNGNTPTCATATTCGVGSNTYSSSFTLGATTTIKAISCQNGANSAVVSGVYTITPVSSGGGGGGGGGGGYSAPTSSSTTKTTSTATKTTTKATDETTTTKPTTNPTNTEANSTSTTTTSGNISTSAGVAVSDVKTSDWFAPYVKQALEMNIASGYADKSFRPANPVVRAEIAKMVVNSFGLKNTSTSSVKFSDVKTSDWFAPYVTTLKTNAVINGYTDGTFKPGAQTTRSEALAIVLRSAGVNLATVNTNNLPFSDVKKSDWYATTVAWAYQNGIVNGRTANTFAPGDVVTRAEIVKIILKVKEVTKK